MTYFLDFDRTLFDTSAFLSYLINRDKLDYYHALSELEMASDLEKRTAEGELAFSEAELVQFLYPDAEAFLAAHHGSIAVVTAGNENLQRAKLANVFTRYASVPLYFTSDERKGPFIARIIAEYPAPYLFADDKSTELDSVALYCPEVELYEVRRDGNPGSGLHAVIRSLSELPV